MTEQPRQRTIGVTSQEKTKLEAAKKSYEQYIGETMDWGHFLGIVAIAGLATLGVYKLVKSRQSNPVTTCAVCGKQFSIAYTGNLPPVVYVKCPGCGEELVVDMTEE